jgi:hypothetical protein
MDGGPVVAVPYATEADCPRGQMVRGKPLRPHRCIVCPGGVWHLTRRSGKWVKGARHGGQQ